MGTYQCSLQVVFLSRFSRTLTVYHNHCKNSASLNQCSATYLRETPTKSLEMHVSSLIHVLKYALKPTHHYQSDNFFHSVIDGWLYQRRPYWIPVFGNTNEEYYTVRPNGNWQHLYLVSKVTIACRCARSLMIIYCL